MKKERKKVLVLLAFFEPTGEHAIHKDHICFRTMFFYLLHVKFDQIWVSDDPNTTVYHAVLCSHFLFIFISVE